MSASWAASAGEVATRPIPRASARDRVLFQSVSWKPARANRSAMVEPIFPVPRTAIRPGWRFGRAFIVIPRFVMPRLHALGHRSADRHLTAGDLVDTGQLVG